MNWIWKSIEKIIDLFLQFVFRIMKKDYTEEIYKSVLQFTRFCIVGVSNVVVSYLIYVAALYSFKKTGLFVKYDYICAQGISFFLSVLWAFYWNEKKVFKKEAEKKRNKWQILYKTYISYSFTGLFLNSMLIYIWVEICKLSDYIAPIINTFITVPINYYINKKWAFKSGTK